MTDNKFELLKGDKVLWMVIIAFSLVSIFFVFSAASNLEYIVRSGTVFSHTLKHAMFIIGGLIIMRASILIKYKYIAALSGFLLAIAIVLLGIASFSGQEIDGASAARWINIGGISFQPSTFAYLMLIIYICSYLTKKVQRERLPIEHIAYLFLPTLIVFGLVGKDNGSTALIILLVSILVMAVGQFPLKYIGGFLGASFLIGGLYIFIALNFPSMAGANRVHTWKSRIETFMGKEDEKNLGQVNIEEIQAKNYQIDRAKAAIIHGGMSGVGPGKSALKQSLPQSASDFIFAIIVEEYGLWGAVFLFFGYAVMLIRIMMIATKIPSFFGTLLTLSIGIMLFVQLAANIAVAVNLIPVTGQPLPLISYGGTSMLVTYLQLGIVLNISTRIDIRDEEGIGRNQTLEAINDIA